MTFALWPPTGSSTKSETLARRSELRDEIARDIVECDKDGILKIFFKYTSWGTMFECLNYLLRRAAENKDAAGRTSETRRAMGAEIGRRLKAGVGLT